MSTLPIRASYLPQLPLQSFARALSVIGVVFDVLTEAQARARAAHQKYPFADW